MGAPTPCTPPSLGPPPPSSPGPLHPGPSGPYLLTPCPSISLGPRAVPLSLPIRGSSPDLPPIGAEAGQHVQLVPVGTT